jgi:hypothetical protein
MASRLEPGSTAVVDRDGLRHLAERVEQMRRQAMFPN